MDHDQLETAYLEIYNDTASNADAAAGSVPLSAVKGKLAGASDESGLSHERILDQCKKPFHIGLHIRILINRSVKNQLKAYADRSIRMICKSCLYAILFFRCQGYFFLFRRAVVQWSHKVL